MELRNWAGNTSFSTDRLHHPETVGQVQEIVRQIQNPAPLDARYVEAERAAIGIEAPGTDHDLAGDIALEARTEQQHRRAVLGRTLHRLPGCGGMSAQAVDLEGGAPVDVLAQHSELFFRRSIGSRWHLAMR